MCHGPSRWLFLLVALALSVVLLAACDDDDDDADGDGDGGGDELTAEEQAAVDYIEGLFATFNSGDIPAFLEEFEEPALRALLEDDETPIEDLKAQAEEFLSGETVEVIETTDVEATTDSATVTQVSSIGATLDNERYELAADDTDFQVSGYEDLPEELPEGASALSVSGVDFGYEFDAESAAGGVEAIDFSNDGEQFHQISLVRLADGSPELDTVVTDFVASSAESGFPDAEYLEEFVTSIFAPPGETSMTVFRDELQPARYVMVCFIPDETQGEEGPPHAELGMASEFTVE
jgi:hypothetical protein